MASPVSTSTRPFGVIAAIGIGIVIAAIGIGIVIAAIGIVFAGTLFSTAIVFAGTLFSTAIVLAIIFNSAIVLGIGSLFNFAIVLGIVSAGMTTAALADILGIFTITITLRVLLVVHEGCLSDCVLAPFFLYPGQGKKEVGRRPWPARQ
jgi:hypothetical protein